VTKQQEKMLDMLVEFHDICEENNLKYYLIGNQLLFAAQNRGIHGYEVEVAMFHSDWKRLQEIVEVLPEIEIESVTDGGKLPGCYYRYVNKNTLLLNLDRYDVYAKLGIGISIYIIRERSNKAELLAYFENGMSDQISGRSSIARKMYEKLLKKKGIKGAAEYLAGMEYEVRSNGREKRTSLKEAYADVCKFASGFWDKRTIIRLAGVNFYTVSGYKTYLKQRYGMKWTTTEPHILKETYRCFFSVVLPYAKYIQEIQKENLLTDDFLEQYKRFVKEYQPYPAMLKVEKEGWEKTMFVAGERYRLWKKYMPLKSEIKQKMDEHRFDEAEVMLQDYIEVLEKYMKMDIVVCFDKECLDMVKELYIQNGKTNKVKSIEEYVLEEDLQPIKIAK